MYSEYMFERCSIYSPVHVTSVSSFLTLQVSEMKPEYFPPKEDVILQNEAPTDLYILVTGSVVRFKICLQKNKKHSFINFSIILRMSKALLTWSLP